MWIISLATLYISVTLCYIVIMCFYFWRNLVFIFKVLKLTRYHSFCVAFFDFFLLLLGSRTKNLVVIIIWSSVFMRNFLLNSSFYVCSTFSSTISDTTRSLETLLIMMFFFFSYLLFLFPDWELWHLVQAAPIFTLYVDHLFCQFKYLLFQISNFFLSIHSVPYVCQYCGGYMHISLCLCSLPLL